VRLYTTAVHNAANETANDNRLTIGPISRG